MNTSRAYRPLRTLLALLAPLGLLQACGVFRSTAPVEQVYVLRPAVQADAGAAGSAVAAVSLQILRPGAQPGLESARIALLRPGGRLDYYANGRWAGALPTVFGALLADTLRSSGDFSNVEEERNGFAGDYLLGITLRHFEAQYEGAAPGAEGGAQARVTLDCTLAVRADRRVLASFRAESVVPVSQARLGAVVAALERAAQEAVADVRKRVTQTIALVPAPPARTSTGPSPP